MSIASQALAPIAARYEALFRVSQAIGAHHDPKELFHVLATELCHVVRFDYLSVLLHNETANRLCWNVLDVADHGRVFRPAEIEPEETMVWWAYQHQQLLLIPSVEQETRFPRVMEFLKREGIQSSCSVPLTTVHRRLGSLGFGSKYHDAYSEEEIRFLSLVADQVALAVDAESIHPFGNHGGPGALPVAGQYPRAPEPD